MSWWAWDGGLGGLTIALCRVDQTLTFSLMQAFNFLAYVASRRERGGFHKMASRLHRVPLACHGPLPREEFCL